MGAFYASMPTSVGCTPLVIPIQSASPRELLDQPISHSQPGPLPQYLKVNQAHFQWQLGLCYLGVSCDMCSLPDHQRRVHIMINASTESNTSLTQRSFSSRILESLHQAADGIPSEV